MRASVAVRERARPGGALQNHADSASSGGGEGGKGRERERGGRGGIIASSDAGKLRVVVLCWYSWKWVRVGVGRVQ